MITGMDKSCTALNPEINYYMLCLFSKVLKKLQSRCVTVPEEVPIKTTSKSEPSVVTTWGSTSRAVKPVYSPETKKNYLQFSRLYWYYGTERFYCRAGFFGSKLVLAMNHLG
jgi:hypothetical protein